MRRAWKCWIFYRMICQHVSSRSHFQECVVVNKEAETKDIIEISEKLVTLYDTKDELRKSVRKRSLEWITAGHEGQRITVQHGEG